MANFDALRSAIIGPLVYMARPQKPADLLLCVPCNGNLTDVSRYNRSLSVTGSPTFGTDDVGGYASGFNLQFDDFDTTQDLTFEGMFYYVSSNGSPYKFGSHYLYNTWSTTGYSFVISINGSDSFQNQACAAGWRHIAFVRKNGYLRMFHNGALIRQDSNNYAVDFVSTTAFGNARFKNIRIVQKALGTDDYFPVPDSYYTGYEAL